MISINNASRASCIQEVESMNNTTPRFNKHDVYKRQHSSLFSSSNITQSMISRNVNPDHTKYMQEYTSLRFGPQTTKPFNIFVGQGLDHNKFPSTQTSGRYKYMPQSRGYSIATSSRHGDDMTEGRHYISFSFKNLDTRDNVDVEIGLMRHIDHEHWTTFKDISATCDAITMAPTTVTFSIRGGSGPMKPISEAFVRDQALTHS